MEVNRINITINIREADENTIIRIIRKVGGLCLMVCCGILCIIGVTSILMNICGYRFLAITTGSMANIYDVGSLIITEKTSPEDIKSGDIISYTVDSQKTIVTHRVIEVDTASRCFYTKGDMNDVEDAKPALYENLVGKVIAGFPYLGYVVIFAKQSYGQIIIGIFVALLIGLSIFSYRSEAEEK